MDIKIIDNTNSFTPNPETSLKKKIKISRNENSTSLPTENSRKSSRNASPSQTDYHQNEFLTIPAADVNSSYSHIKLNNLNKK